jgi:hypothetical protein
MLIRIINLPQHIHTQNIQNPTVVIKNDANKYIKNELGGVKIQKNTKKVGFSTRFFLHLPTLPPE